MPKIKTSNSIPHAVQSGRQSWDAFSARRTYSLESDTATHYFRSVKPLDGVRQSIILFRDADEVSAPALLRFKYWVREAIYDPEYGDHYIKRIDEDFGGATDGLAVLVTRKKRIEMLAKLFASMVEKRNSALNLIVMNNNKRAAIPVEEDAKSVDSIGPEIEAAKDFKRSKPLAIDR